MASRIEFPPLPSSVAVLPFLFMAGRAGDRDWDFNVALRSAVAAEEAHGEKRNSRRRVAYLLCEVAAQYGRRCGDYAAPVPLSRAELARALGVSLCKVKRILALLTLSQVIASDGESVRILDWTRLSAMAGYDKGRLGSLIGDGDEEDFLAASAPEPEDEPRYRLTASGEPAFFG